MQEPATTIARCPTCGSDRTIPIFYGYPVPDSMDPLLAAVDRGVIELGVCEVTENQPTHHCKNCGQYYRSV